jgi:transcriptional regulator with XRE-family HTH domain
MKTIGKTLRVLRNIAGIKQGDLASRINVSANYISLVENGKKEPSLKFLQRIADELKIPVTVFFWDNIQVNNIEDERQRVAAEKLNELYWDLIRLRLSDINSK